MGVEHASSERRRPATSVAGEMIVDLAQGPPRRADDCVELFENGNSSVAADFADPDATITDRRVPGSGDSVRALSQAAAIILDAHEEAAASTKDINESDLHNLLNGLFEPEALDVTPTPALVAFNAVDGEAAAASIAPPPVVDMDVPAAPAAASAWPESPADDRPSAPTVMRSIPIELSGSFDLASMEDEPTPSEGPAAADSSYSVVRGQVIPERARPEDALDIFESPMATLDFDTPDGDDEAIDIQFAQSVAVFDQPLGGARRSEGVSSQIGRYVRDTTPAVSSRVSEFIFSEPPMAFDPYAEEEARAMERQRDSELFEANTMQFIAGELELSPPPSPLGEDLHLLNQDMPSILAPPPSLRPRASLEIDMPSIAAPELCDGSVPLVPNLGPGVAAVQSGGEPRRITSAGVVRTPSIARPSARYRATSALRKAAETVLGLVVLSGIVYAVSMVLEIQ